MLRFAGLGLLGGILVAGAGCRSTSDWNCCRGNPPPKTVVVPPTLGPAPTTFVQPQPSSAFAPPGGVPGLPPGAVLTLPPGARTVPPGPQPTITNAPPAGTMQPRVDPEWKPAEARHPAPRVEPSRDAPPRINLYAPEPVDKDTSKDRFSLDPPQVETQRKQGEEPPLKKPLVQGNVAPIKQFERAKENVFAGLRPPLDGLDWLQAAGVRTVVQVRLPNQDDSADRTQVEKRDMRYVAFEVSPQTLTREKVAEFVKLIRTGAKQGIFVYDEDGSLAGSMWYLHMRLGEILDDDAAKLRTYPLGLAPDRPGQSREMWQAVQKLLDEIR